jgi:hypothetical protein
MNKINDIHDLTPPLPTPAAKMSQINQARSATRVKLPKMIRLATTIRLMMIRRSNIIRVVVEPVSREHFHAQAKRVTK